MAEGYTCTVMIPEGQMVKIEEDGSVEVLCPRRKLTADEFAVIACMGQMLARLKNGKLVSFDFEPKSFENSSQLTKCEWLRSGNLKIHGPADKPYRFVDSIDKALMEARTFTCPKSVSELLPRHRVVPVVVPFLPTDSLITESVRKEIVRDHAAENPEFPVESKDIRNAEGEE